MSLHSSSIVHVACDHVLSKRWLRTQRVHKLTQETQRYATQRNDNLGIIILGRVKGRRIHVDNFDPDTHLDRWACLALQAMPQLLTRDIGRPGGARCTCGR